MYVAAYDYPPYFSMGLETDVTRELIQILNEYQDTYDFQLQVIPPNGRYQALSENGCCDVIFFESEELDDWDEERTASRNSFEV